MEKRLNIRIDSDDYLRLQEIKRAHGLVTDSAAVRAMIDTQHETLAKAGAFRTIERLTEQTTRGGANGKRKKPKRRA